MKNDRKMEVVKTVEKDAQNDMFEALIESVIPLIQPLIKPATKKFTDFMNDGNMIMIRTVKKEVHVFHIKSKDVDKFEMKEGTEPAGIYPMDQFIESLISGNFGNL